MSTDAALSDDAAARPILVAPSLLSGDFARLAQVFANLLSNSAKYTEPGGRIEVTVRKSGAEAVMTVSDTGIGIPRESLDVVFDMFSQVQAHRQHAGGGLGIGLALVRRLAELHGGSVSAHSLGIGMGSTFTVRLPALADRAPLVMDLRPISQAQGIEIAGILGYSTLGNSPFTIDLRNGLLEFRGMAPPLQMVTRTFTK